MRGVEVGGGGHFGHLAGTAPCSVQDAQEVTEAGVGGVQQLLVAGGVEQLTAASPACSRLLQLGYGVPAEDFLARPPN
jgi:hypothetical protein